MRCGRAPADSLEDGSQFRPRRMISWTHARVLRAIRVFGFFQGRAPGRRDWHGPQARDWPPIEIVESLFGSVTAAVRAAGLEPDPSGALDRRRR
jgi:hypothetical protein